MSSRLLKIVLIVGALLMFCACTPTPTPTIAPFPVVTCPPGYLVQPSLTSPADGAVVDSLSPVLSWTFPAVPYPAPGAPSTCIPEGYNVELSTGPFFMDNLGGATNGKLNTFTPFNELLLGKMYQWGVQGTSEGVLGPFAGYRYFFTGEDCAPAAFVAPQLLIPANNEMVSTLNPILTWVYPDDCLTHYRVDLSTESAFADTSLAGGTGSPDTRWGPGDPLEDCTRYYWKIRAVSPDGTVLGPASPTFSFLTNMGTCAPPEGYESTISYRGRVWEDLCAIPEIGPLPDPLPTGCISKPGGGATGDGIRSPGEPGIGNVMVHLGSGPCPSTNMGVKFTDANGEYSFDYLPAGMYCISVDALENASVLVPGEWTSPAIDGSLAQGTFNLLEGSSLQNIDFGWRYQFGPSVEFSVLNGLVWDDQCDQTNLVNPASVHEGCVKDYWGTVTADGLRQSGEPGIENILVWLHKGTCGESSPVVSYAFDRTDGSGLYQFYLPKYQTNSDYCVEIIADDSANQVALMPGIWTLPDTPHLTAVHNVNFFTPETFTRDFGWDRTNSLFAIPDWPFFELEKEDYCFVGPSFDFKAFRKLPLGNVFYLEALDPTGKWALIDPDTPINPNANCVIDPEPPSLTHIDDEVTWATGLEQCGLIDPDPSTVLRSIRCWIRLDLGRAEGQLGDLPRLFVPLILTPTPTPTPPPPVSSGCGDYTTKDSCTRHANDGCYWLQINDKLGYCLKK